MDGLLAYLVFFLTMVGIYGVFVLGLNIQWGYAGMFNIGVGAFFALGAYVSAILTSDPSDAYLGGFGLSFGAGVAAAALAACVMAVFVGAVTARLRSDYLAIATLGLAEILRLILKNEQWLTGGVRGLGPIPNPAAVAGGYEALAYLAIVFAFVALFYALSARAYRAPWGRAMRAIREDEEAAAAIGKDVSGFRLQAFVLGAAPMGVAGALYAHFVGFISPEAFNLEFATLLLWVMLVAGGSGNLRGALLGVAIVWTIWSGAVFATPQLPAEYASDGAALRVLIIGLLLIAILIWRPEGLSPEKPPKPVA